MDQSSYKKSIDQAIAFLQMIAKSGTLTPDQRENVDRLIVEWRQLKSRRNDQKLRKLIRQTARPFLKTDSQRIEV